MATDGTQTAFAVMKEFLSRQQGADVIPFPAGKNPAAVALGRAGGLKGGKANQTPK